MAGAEEVQYPNNPIVPPAPAQVAPLAQVAPPAQYRLVKSSSRAFKVELYMEAEKRVRHV